VNRSTPEWNARYAGLACVMLTGVALIGCVFPFADDGAALRLAWIEIYGTPAVIEIPDSAVAGEATDVRIVSWGGCYEPVVHTRVDGEGVWVIPFELHKFDSSLCPGSLRPIEHLGTVTFPEAGLVTVLVPGFRERLDGPADSVTWSFPVVVR
jgi:hypothetical protein